MRKKSIINDFKNKPLPGSLIMDKTTNFMNGILMDIDDIIRISYYYTINDLGLSNNILKNLSNINYDTLKKQSITIKEDTRQSSFDNEKNTSWLFKLDSKNLLREYLYNEIFVLNNNSPFRQIPTTVINENDLGNLCYEYIDKNILSMYEVSEFILWTQYFDLNLNTVPGSGSGTGVAGDINPSIKLLYKTPEYSFRAIPQTQNINIDIDNQKESITLRNLNNGIYEIGYKQTRSSQFQTFIYYYDVIFSKI